MGKRGEVWDDSALINALDDAISMYKIMHKEGGHDTSLKEAKASNTEVEFLSTPIDESHACFSTPADDSHEIKRHADVNDENISALHNTAAMGETSNLASTKENNSICTDEHYVNGHGVEGSNDTRVNTQGWEDCYSHLCDEYNKLEEQRQKVIKKFYQHGYWIYQDYGDDVQGNASVEHQVPAVHASSPAVISSCQSCPCSFSTSPCTSLVACPLSGTCVDRSCAVMSTTVHEQCAVTPEDDDLTVTPEDDDLIRTVMGAVERALGTLKTKTSDVAEVNQESGEEKEAETVAAESSGTKKSETNLSVVLNAWFSAGFYTGKYLAEHSGRK